MSKEFIHLHVHTEMSLLDGAARMQKGKKSPLFQACKDKQMSAIAITDHGAMYGVYTFQRLAKDYNIKPIIGCELYICNNMYEKSGKDYDHILLLAKTNEGYRNLVKLDSLAFTKGFYYKPRIDFDLLQKHAKGIICTSACIGGTIPQLLINNRYDEAKELAIRMRDMFEPGDFYLEIQDHGIPEERLVNPLLVQIGKEIGVKVVATNDVHYIEKEDWEMHDVLLCMQTKRNIDDPNRMRFYAPEFYLKTYEEMETLFSWCPEALETPQEIADKCVAVIEPEDLMPPYEPEDKSSPNDFLRKLTEEGLIERYGDITTEIRSRADYELDIIKQKFSEYYLIVWDFIHYAKTHDIPVGAGRGSGVGSIVAYAIGITNVDPLKYNLLFERFLNPERVSNPDFDIDFCVEGREQVIKYVVNKYGENRVCQILALGTLATKNAIKNVARVYNVPLNEVNALTKLIPNGKVKLEDVLGLSDASQKNKSLVISEIVDAYTNDSVMRKVLNIALKVEGFPSNCSKHAAGVVICKEVISDFVPLSKSGNDITTQFQKDEVEKIGMLKMDFLGLRTLTDIKKAKQYIKEEKGIDIDFAKLGYEDRNVFDLIGSGDTDAIFQLESPGMKKFMKQLMPDSLEDIIAGISLYRPGPMDSIPKYVECKNNPEKITYDHPLLEPILNLTYGCIVYQEQVMQIVRDLGGFSLGKADLLRRAMSKKDLNTMLAEKDVFINGSAAVEPEYDDQGKLLKAGVAAVDGAVRRGVPQEIAAKIFGEMESFASYAFNKSHAAAYAVVAYETAYLKYYYKVQFIAAVINNRITNSNEIAKYVEYLRGSNIELFPPDINKSNVGFNCDNGNLRFGLMGVKNVGEAAISAVVKDRNDNGEFTSFANFLKRVDAYNINKRLVESLIKAGAFDCFGETRATLMANYDRIMTINSLDSKKRAYGQISLFSMLSEEDNTEIKLIQVPEYSLSEKLIFEKQMLNIYLSGHPLDDYRTLYLDMPFNLSIIKNIIDYSGNTKADDEGIEDDNEDAEMEELANQYDKMKISLGGMLSDMRKSNTRDGKSMAMGKIEDLYATVNLVVFNKTYERIKDSLLDDKIVIIQGELQMYDNKGELRPQIRVDNIKPWQLSNDQIATQQSSNIQNKTDSKINLEDSEDNYSVFNKLYVNVIGDNESIIEELVAILEHFPGSVPCLIQFKNKLLNSNKSVRITKNLLWMISGLLGQNNYRLV